jgi:hypothetical protein
MLLSDKDCEEERTGFKDCEEERTGFFDHEFAFLAF